MTTLATHVIQAALPENSFLKNSSFSSPDLEPWGSYGGAVLTRETPGATAFDAWACQVVAPSAFSGLQQRLDVQDLGLRGKIIVAGAWVKVLEGDVTISLVRDSDDAVVWSSPLCAAKDWTPVFCHEGGIQLDAFETHVRLRIHGGNGGAKFLVDDAVLAPLPDSLQEMSRKINLKFQEASVTNWLRVSPTTPPTTKVLIRPGWYYTAQDNLPVNFPGMEVGLAAFSPEAGKRRWVFVGISNASTVLTIPGPESFGEAEKPRILNGSCPCAFVLLETSANGQLLPVLTVEDIRPFFKFTEQLFSIDGGLACTVFTTEDMESGVDGGSPYDEFAVVDTGVIGQNGPGFVGPPLATEMSAGIVRLATAQAIKLGLGDGVVRSSLLKPYLDEVLAAYNTGNVFPDFPWLVSGDEGKTKDLATDENGDIVWRTPGPRSQEQVVLDSGALMNQVQTVPAYVVGRKNLWVFLDGVKCYPGQTFDEVGEPGKLSTQIRWKQNMPVDSELEFIVW